jgi:hypothetical protein
MLESLLRDINWEWLVTFSVIYTSSHTFDVVYDQQVDSVVQFSAKKRV